jgi:hypothetical protein
VLQAQRIHQDQAGPAEQRPGHLGQCPCHGRQAQQGMGTGREVLLLAKRAPIGAATMGAMQSIGMQVLLQPLVFSRRSRNP